VLLQTRGKHADRTVIRTTLTRRQRELWQSGSKGNWTQSSSNNLYELLIIKLIYLNVGEVAHNDARKRTALRQSMRAIRCLDAMVRTGVQVTNRLPHPHRDYFDRKLHFVAEPVIVIRGLRN
jgi:hypothetical protein